MPVRVASFYVCVVFCKDTVTAFRCLVGESYSGIHLLLNSTPVWETDAGWRDPNIWVRLVVCNGAKMPWGQNEAQGVHTL